METKLNIPTTEFGKSYWNGEGLYQAEYELLYDTLVPARGKAENLFGELIRAVSRLGYEYYNNGNCNACELNEIEGEWVECPYCHGSGVCEKTWDDEDEEDYPCDNCGGEGGYYEESEYETSLHPFYENFLTLIRDFFKVYMPAAESIVDDVEKTILSGDEYTFSKIEERPYVLMTDAVVYIIEKLKQAEELSPEIPEWYKN